MASQPFTVRFPNGMWEYRFVERVPKVGETLVQGRKKWVVVTVSPASSGGPVVKVEPAPESVPAR